MGFRAFWDAETDSFAQDTFVNVSVFIVLFINFKLPFMN